ncbi:ankyrin repeat and SAM domain-containing protein 3-like isoform X1 [Homalodisca vitripennis]|uniref:ankyrin repeat and SAM domain-containing protein 3-like isoform X1 n=2 Tax=Homalodisca vitripennis TaxID=197043 RepID=UPI001EEC125F|nr:ankyrin repeat and SAM domain-containing protein 3-like isoform X1 [Homalodisca vitripennis]XP_046663630.1 ankyrin repeat and SAM domain-containing protein 3-like isoform X1 [Homalodisca vitripennis]
MDFESEVKHDIYTACSLGDEKHVHEILESWPVDVNARNAGGWTPLMYACWGTHERVVTCLLAAGADRKILNFENQTALHLAAKSGSLTIAQLTFQKGIVDFIDSQGKTALYSAVEFGHVDIVGYLLSEGADVNYSCQGMTPLMVAAAQGQRCLVEVLVKHGANKRTRNQQGFTASQLAAKNGHLELAQLLDTSEQDISNLETFLETLSLEKYWPIFKNKNIDLKSFLNFSEDDLKSFGIKLLGPRRKMSIAISAYKKNHQ